LTFAKLNKLSLQINPIYRAALSFGMATLLFLNEFGTATEIWWSLQPPANVNLPPTRSAKHPIDGFIQHRLAKTGLGFFAPWHSVQCSFRKGRIGFAHKSSARNGRPAAMHARNDKPSRYRMLTVPSLMEHQRHG
jgi:hypothetical protein